MPIVGIDLGTTNSLVGIIDKGRPRLFPGENGNTLVPSVVAFREGTPPVVGSPAKERKAHGDKNVIYSAKRFIGRGIDDVGHWTGLLPFDFSGSDKGMIRFGAGGKHVTPIEVSAQILKKLKSLAEAGLGEPVSGAVITVPAYFNDSQRQATKFAGELAGLDVKRIVNEPTAACLAYGLDKKTLGTIAVFDLGGGTFDISILRVKDGVFEVLATNGDTGLGGDDFDHAIAEKLAVEIKNAKGTDPMASPQLRAALVSESERLKRELTDSDSVAFSFSGLSRRITRAELETWIEPVLKRAEGPCLQCLKDAKVSPDTITDVILVGGSTRSPRISSFVERIFRRAPICTLNPDEVVAMGAAVQANILSGQTAGMLLLDVIPLSLGIETMGGVVSRLIHRNSTVPISSAESFSTYVDGQTAVAIHVLQGERELAADNRSLARFELRGLPPMPAGIPKIELEFIVDVNGILSVRAMELRTGKQASVTVNPSYGLNDTEIEKMLFEAYENAESDFEARFLAEARTEGDGLVRAARKSLAKGRSLVNEEEARTIEKAVLDLEAGLSLDDRNLIKRRIERLNETTRGLAEKLLNQAVAEALKDKEIGQ